ncbi:MAG: F0F1 ATP synthase subunit epsilon [Rhodospirillales bacterium]|nr:F0F1 ATP synthase subunit epsilon [Rhodospirillales bacterium]
MPTPFKCSLVTPEAELLATEAIYASIPVHDGQLGVMHLRAPLVAKLGSGPLRLDIAESDQRLYFVSGGFMQVKDDVLTILTDEATPVEELDRTDAEAALAEALAYQPRTEGDRQRKERDVERARGMLAAMR